MRILIRIITLPLAWLLWTISYTYHWIRYGGELQVNIKPIIKPEEFYRLLTEVSERLKDFEAQKEETLHWKRLYENYDLNHCATFVKQQEEIDILNIAYKQITCNLEESESKILILNQQLQDSKILLDLERSSRNMDRTLAVSQVAVGLSKVDELIEENVKLKQEVANNAFECLKLKKQLKEVTQKQVDDYCKSIETEQGLTVGNYPTNKDIIENGTQQGLTYV